MHDGFPADLDEMVQPHNDTTARLKAAGLPYAWSWDTIQHADRSPITRDAVTILRTWSMSPKSSCLYGILLHGGAGLGKTGIAVSVIRDAAERPDGARGVWNLVTAPKVLEAVGAGDFRPRPAPAMFYRWRDLKSLLDRAKVGQTPWDEMPPLTAEKVLREIEDRCVVVALDDIDVDTLTPWKEEILLRLLDLPLRGTRVVITTNANPASPEGIARLGERVVDRLLDAQLFARFALTGDSLRRRKSP